MKAKLVALLLLALGGSAMATVTLNTQFGTAYSSTGTAVPDGTLWILVVDTNDNNLFGGGNMGLNSSLTAQQANATFSIGQALSVGSTLGSDTIFAMGGFNGAGTGLGLGATGNGLSGLSLGTNGLAAGLDFTFYYFPGVTYNSGGPNLVGTQVGGINRSGADAGALLDGMVIPSDGAQTSPGAANSDFGGSVTNAQFTAVNLIPEPSTALLGAIGALGLLRRRR